MNELTAQQAAEIASRHCEPRPKIVGCVLACYLEAIRHAAELGSTHITHDDPDKMRTQVWATEKKAVADRLRALGYEVDDQGVSW